MIIHIKVKPNSLKDEIERVGNFYNVSVREPAENGRANVKLINLLAKEFNVDFRKIKVKNPKSKRKIIEIDLS